MPQAASRPNPATTAAASHHVRRESAFDMACLQRQGDRILADREKWKQERGQVYLLCFVRPLAWTMRRAGRSEASGLRFDHGLEGVAAQCPLLLEIQERGQVHLLEQGSECIFPDLRKWCRGQFLTSTAARGCHP